MPTVDLSLTEEAILVWTRRTTSILSILASTAIVYMIVADRKFKLKQPSHRFLLLMSFFDIIQSTAQAFGSAPISRDMEAYGAIGNIASCKTQGFFIQLGITVPLYNASLSLFYLLSIRYNMTNETFAKRVEPYCHFVSISYPLATALAGLYLDLIGRRGLICWIGNGKNWLIFSTIILILGCLVFISCTMVMTYLAVSKRDSAMRQYDYVSPQGRRNSLVKKGLFETRETLLQATYYVAAFFITFFPALLTITVTELFSSSYPLRLVSVIFFPLQGFWNFLIYIRRGYFTLKKENPDRSCFWVLYTLIVIPSSTRRMKKRSLDKTKMNGSKPMPKETVSRNSNNGTDNLFYSDSDVVEHTEEGSLDKQGNSLSLDGDAIVHVISERRPSLIDVFASSCGNTSQMIQLEDNDTQEPLQVQNIDIYAFKCNDDLQMIQLEENNTEISKVVK